MIYWFIGYPGVGKGHCAQRLSMLLNCRFIDADDYLNKSETDKLLSGNFTSEDRLRKLMRVCDDIKVNYEDGADLTVADSLPNESSRKFILEAFPNKVTLIHVTAPKHIHVERIRSRKGHFFTPNLLAKYIEDNWEPINCPHVVFENESNDNKILDMKLRTLLKSISKVKNKT